MEPTCSGCGAPAEIVDGDKSKCIDCWIGVPDPMADINKWEDEAAGRENPGEQLCPGQ